VTRAEHRDAQRAQVALCSRAQPPVLRGLPERGRAQPERRAERARSLVGLGRDDDESFVTAFREAARRADLARDIVAPSLRRSRK
jgi:hypothetical protein